jgi:hypothetical protein
LPLVQEIWKQGIQQWSWKWEKTGKSRGIFFCVEKMFLSISKSKNLPCLLEGCVVFNLACQKHKKVTTNPHKQVLYIIGFRITCRIQKVTKAACQRLRLTLNDLGKSEKCDFRGYRL